MMIVPAFGTPNLRRAELCASEKDRLTRITLDDDSNGLPYAGRPRPTPSTERASEISQIGRALFLWQASMRDSVVVKAKYFKHEISAKRCRASSSSDTGVSVSHRAYA